MSYRDPWAPRMEQTQLIEGLEAALKEVKCPIKLVSPPATRTTQQYIFVSQGGGPNIYARRVFEGAAQLGQLWLTRHECCA